MRALFFHIPSLGGYHAIEPVLSALQDRGTEVIHYNESGFRQYVGVSSIPFQPYRNYEGYYPAKFSNGMGLHELGLLLLDTAEHTMDFVEEQVRREHPDLILHSKFTAAPKAIASKYGIPAVCLTNANVFHPNTFLDDQPKNRCAPDMSAVPAMLRFRRRASEFYRKHLKEVSDPNDIFVNDEALNLVLSMEMFQPGRSKLPAHCKFIGPTARIEGQLKSYDLIYVSLGSVFVNNRSFFQLCIEALADFKRPVLISLGDGLSPEEFPDIPGNVQVSRFVRQKDVLQRTAVFITHGGDNSVAEAINSSTPMVVVPQIPEQTLRAQTIETMRIGCWIESDHLSVPLLRSKIAEVLHNDEFRSNIKALRQTLPEVPPAVTACEEIEAFVRGGRRELVAHAW